MGEGGERKKERGKEERNATGEAVDGESECVGE